MTNSTLTKTMKTVTWYQKNTVPIIAEKSKNDEGQDVNVVFIPEKVTPLSAYKAELLKAGLSKKHVDEIIEGLADSPLYEGKTTQ